MKLLSCLLSVFFCLLCNAQTTSSGAAKPAKSAEVFFEFGKHELVSSADTILGKLVAFIKGKDNFNIKITAHTDSIGSIENNEALSLRRAEVVKKYLTENGVSAERIEFSFFGEKMPVTTNGTELGRQQNRRALVEVFLTRPMVLVTGIILDEKTQKPLVADVIIRSKEKVDTIKTGTDGKFETRVPPATVLNIDAFAPCYFIKTETISAMPKLPPISMHLKPTEKGAIADIDNLYFVGNQATLLESSVPVLPKILRFMEMNPSMKIEIAGHVNVPNEPKVSTISSFFILSEKRAQVVYNYLKQNGISQDRISWKGYGNWEMRMPFAMKEEDQAKNRRVEIRVIENGCH